MPEVANPKIIKKKQGSPQIISLSPLPKGGISISAQNTITSMQHAMTPVTAGKYLLT